MNKAIANEALLTRLKAAVEVFLETDAVSDSRQIGLSLESFLTRNREELKLQPAVLARYESILGTLKLIYLFDLEEKELVGLLSDKMSEILESEYYDPFEKLRHKLVTIYDLDERDKIKAEIREKLMRNRQEITKNKINFKNETKSPTIGNWLKYYSVQLGIDSVDALKFNQYFMQDDNIQSLSDSEKNILKKLFNFFEKLKISSSSSLGIEEKFVAIFPGGKIGLMNNGIPVDPDPAVLKIYQEISSQKLIKADNNQEMANDILADDSPISELTPKSSPLANALIPRTTELEEILDSYSPASLEYKAISQEIMRLKKTEARKNAKR